MRGLFLLSFILISSVTKASEETCTHDASAFRCVTYVRNYDADTVTVSIPDTHPLFGHEISVRLKGIDTPEVRTKDDCEKKLGLEGKQLIANILTNAQRIDLKDLGRDKYFRILADVVVDGQSLSTLLLRSKLAYPYDGGTKSRVDWCRFRADQGEK